MAKKPAKAKSPKPSRQKATGKPKSAPREKVPRGRREKHPCAEMRLAIIVGSRTDRDLRGAEGWAIARARALGGTTHLWRSYSASSPMREFRAADISGGNIQPDRTRYRRRNDGSHNFGSLLPDFQDCRGRITELVIFHHGSPVDEAELAQELLAIFRAIRVPVCRVVWWACNAAVALDVGEGMWTDTFMKAMGGIARCEPCGCGQAIELVWPTEGKCGINDPANPVAALTGSGKVNRARWGYPQPDGSVGPRPDPAESHHSRNATHRDPPHGQPVPQVGGSVMGVPVSQGTF